MGVRIWEGDKADRLVHAVQDIAGRLNMSKQDIVDAVEGWMNENIHEDPTVVIDGSLSVSGAAADAAETGYIKTALNNVVVAYNLEKPSTQTSKVFECSISSGKTYSIKNNGANNVNVRTCVSDGTAIEVVKNGITPGETVTFTAKEDASYVRLYADGAVISKVSITTTGDVIDNVKTLFETGDAALNARIDSNAEKELYLASKFGLRRAYPRYRKQVVLPDELAGISSQITVFTDGWNYYHNFDIDSKKVSGGATYYVSPEGNTNPASSSIDSPTSIYQIIHNGLLVNGVTIYFTDGVYGDFTRQTASDHDITASCNLIAINPGKVIERQAASLPTFTSIGNGKYTATRSNVANIFQKIGDEIVPFTKVATVNDCSLEGTWFLDSENLLTIHCFGNVEPNREYLFVCLNYGVPILKVAPSGNANVYVEGITFVGGAPATCEVIEAEGATVNFYAKNCKFYGAYDPNLARDAVSIRGANSYLVNCEAMYASKDGFNYHKSGDNIPQFIEIDCIGGNNGLDGIAEATEQYYSNGSTAHDGVVGLRLGGYYFNNYGGNVADVHQGTTTVNIGCTAFDSAAPASNVIAQADFVAQQAGTTMYLIGCRAFGSASSAYAVANTTISIKTCDLEHSPVGSGTIITQ